MSNSTLRPWGSISSSNGCINSCNVSLVPIVGNNSVQFNNFTEEAGIFIPSVTTNPSMVLSTFNNGFVTFAGNQDYAANYRSMDCLACMLPGSVFPDNNTGNIVISASFDKYCPHYDANNVNEVFLFGLFMYFSPSYISEPTNMWYLGMGRRFSAAGNNGNYGCVLIAEGETYTSPNNMVSYATIANNWSNDIIGTNASFTVMASFLANQNYQGHHIALARTDITTSWNNGDANNNTNMLGAGTVSPRIQSTGVRIGAGCFPGIASNTATARLLALTIHQGRYYATR